MLVEFEVRLDIETEERVGPKRGLKDLYELTPLMMSLIFAIGWIGKIQQAELYVMNSIL
jgi:hypothetical protein